MTITKGPLESFTVVYQHDTGIYRPGDTLSGQIEIKLRQAATLRGVRVQFKGRSCFLGSQSKDGAVEKVFFNRDMVLFDRPPGKEPGAFSWAAGSHFLPFECPLPKSCSTSFESPTAFTRYFSRATLIQTASSGEENIFVTKTPFMVIGDEKVALEEKLLRPVSTNESVMLSGLCCCRGQLSAEFSMPRSYYVPGESIVGTIKVDNKHPREFINDVKCQLVELVGGRNTQQKSERVLMEKRLENSALSGKQNLNRENVSLLQVPALFLSQKLTNNKSSAEEGVFYLDYEFRVSIAPHISLSLPLVIGYTQVSGKNGAASFSRLEEFVLGAQPIKESDDPKEILGTAKFAPKYPVFGKSSEKRGIMKMTPNAEHNDVETNNSTHPEI